jgi:selenocysteine lyase/cysteine desulfurase
MTVKQTMALDPGPLHPADAGNTSALLDVERVRQEFPILREKPYCKPLVYLDSAATSQKPQAVIDAMSGFYSRDDANMHRGVHYLSERATEACKGARAKVQGFLNAAHAQEIVSSVLDSVHPHDIGTILDRQGVAIRAGHHCAQPLLSRLGLAATARASLACYSTRQDIDTLVAGLGTVQEAFR